MMPPTRLLCSGAVPASPTCAPQPPAGTLEKQDAPHYLPLPTPTLGHYLKLEEAHLRAYLVQLVAGYPGAVHVLLAGAESADQQRTNSLLQTLAVVPGVSVHCLPGVQHEKYLQALQSSLQSELSHLFRR